MFIMFGLWIVVFTSMFGLSQIFSDKSNLIILVDIQRLYENGKCILCVSNGVYVFLKKLSCCSTQNYSTKLFHLQQSYSILDSLYGTNSSNT